MRTVKSLIEELGKFPQDAVCFAYEGEVSGIIIEHAGHRMLAQGVIHCGEGDREEHDTEELPSLPNAQDQP